MVVIAQCIESTLTRVDDQDEKTDSMGFSVGFPNSFTHKVLYGLKVLHVLAMSDNVKSAARKAAINNEVFRIQVISEMAISWKYDALFNKGDTCLLFLQVLGNTTEHVKNHNPDTLENMRSVDGLRSEFAYGKAYSWQRDLMRSSFQTEKMKDLTEATAMFCELMKKGVDSSKQLEELSKDPRFIYSSIAKQIMELPEDKRTPFIYTNSKLPVLPADKPARNPYIPEK